MAENTPPIQVYIENANDSSIGGFTIPLPTTKEALAPWFAAIEVDGTDPRDIAIRDIKSEAIPLKLALAAELTLHARLNELNYLAAKLRNLSHSEMEIVHAALDAGRYCGNVTEFINLTENLGSFDLQPAFSEEQYGDFLIDTAKDNTAEAFKRLEKSDNEEDRELAAHILNMEAHIDKAAFGRDMAERENGVFTKHGYLIEGEGFITKYHGLDDIPKEYRIFPREEPLLKVADVDLAPFLVKLHALAGDYSRDIAYNVETLSKLRSSEYLLLMNDKNAYLTEAAHAYRRGTSAYDLWLTASDDPGTKMFAIHITEVHSRLAGDVYQVNVTEQQKDIINHSIQPIGIEATLGNGETQKFTPMEWDALSPLEKDRLQNLRREFNDDDFPKIRRHLDDIREEYADAGKPIKEDAFIANLNNGFMDQAWHHDNSFLRVTQEAAKEMLARGDAEVYRLLPDGAEKLCQIDAVKSGLWFAEFREFAVKREDMPKLNAWAERNAGELARRAQERDEHKKSHEPEV